MHRSLQRTALGWMATGLVFAALFFVLALLRTFQNLPSRTTRFEEILLAAGGALIFAALSWACVRAVRAFRRL